MVAEVGKTTGFRICFRAESKEKRKKVGLEGKKLTSGEVNEGGQSMRTT